MITPSFGLAATERVLPKLALDFTTASLDPRVTFTRTTDATHPATYVASTGYVTSATNNQPRFDYNPLTLACKGLLIEESRTNIQTYSEDFGNVIWNKVRASVSTDQISSPNNAIVADKVIEDSSASTTHFLRQDINLTSGTTYSFSIFAKAGERPALEIKTGTDFGVFADQQVKFNLSTGVATNTGAGTPIYSMIPFGNGWYRCVITVTALATALGVIRYFLNDGNSSSYSGNGTSGLYVWGAQLEAGAFATSYIPTTTTALTRNADVATMTGTNFSSWFNASEGAVKTAVIPSTISGTRPLIQFDDNTATNQICLRGNSANPELYIKTTTDQAQIDAGTIVANTAYKLSGAWNTNSCAAAQNGTSVVEDTSATIPTVTQARIGSDGTNYANAWIQKISYWPQRLINAEVQAFS